MNDWQSWTALAIVILTALIFVAKRVKKKPSSCGHDCGCGKSSHAAPDFTKKAG